MSEPIPTVGVLICHGDDVLLTRTHKWGDRWSIPGGKIEPGESIETAIHREVREETGLEIRDVKPMPTLESIYSEEFHQRRHFLLLNYVATSDSREVTLSDEHQEYRWVPPRQALDFDLNTATRQLVLNLLDVIAVTDLAVDCVIGVYAHERVAPQRLYVSVELRTDTGAAGESDDVADTLDYDQVKELVLQLAGREYDLLEAFAADLAEGLIRRPDVWEVTVTLKKPDAIPEAEHTSVRITRR